MAILQDAVQDTDQDADQDAVQNVDQDAVQDADQDVVQDVDQEQVSNHSEFIRICLDIINTSNTYHVKAIHAKILYDYLACQALNFVMRRLHFKDVAIQKAYELKITCTDFHELQNSLNYFLITIGETL